MEVWVRAKEAVRGTRRLCKEVMSRKATSAYDAVVRTVFYAVVSHVLKADPTQEFVKVLAALGNDHETPADSSDQTLAERNIEVETETKTGSLNS